MTNSIETITLSIPCHWISAVLFGNVKSLDPEERRAFNIWWHETLHDLGHGKPVHVGTVRDTPYFDRYHDAVEYGVYPCLCVDVDLILH